MIIEQAPVLIIIIPLMSALVTPLLGWIQPAAHFFQARWGVGRFTPSTEQALGVNATKATNSSSVYASLNNAGQPLKIGSYNASSYPFGGDWSIAFICAAAPSDSLINLLWHWSKRLYGYG